MKHDAVDVDEQTALHDLPHDVAVESLGIWWCYTRFGKQTDIRMISYRRCAFNACTTQLDNHIGQSRKNRLLVRFETRNF